MKHSSIKKALQTVWLIGIFSTCFTIANAQSTNSDMKSDSTTATDELIVPQSYPQTQDEQLEINSTGTATYTIDESNTAGTPEIPEARSKGNVEELRVYSGYQNGNNIIKTIEVEVPQK